MSKENSIILFDVQFKEKRTSSELAMLLNKLEYSDAEGIGFKDVSSEGKNLIVGEVLKKTSIYINIFNPITQEIEKKEEYVLSEIEFAIDVENLILEAYTNNREVRKLLLIFRSLAKEVLLINQLSFFLSSLMFALKDQASTLEIKKMCIRDFQYSVGVTGTYDMIFQNPEIAWVFLEKYQTGINSITFHLSYEDWEIILLIGSNGQIKFNNKSKRSMSKCLELLKSLIVKSNYHA